MVAEQLVWNKKKWHEIGVCVWGGGVLRWYIPFYYAFSNTGFAGMTKYLFFLNLLTQSDLT